MDGRPGSDAVGAKRQALRFKDPQGPGRTETTGTGCVLLVRGKALQEPEPLAPERPDHPLSPAPPEGLHCPLLSRMEESQVGSGQQSRCAWRRARPSTPWAQGAGPEGASSGSPTFSDTLQGATRRAYALPPGGWACGCACRDWPSGRLAIGCNPGLRPPAAGGGAQVRAAPRVLPPGGLERLGAGWAVPVATPSPPRRALRVRTPGGSED